MLNKGFLIRMMNCENEIIIKTFYSTEIAELLKFYIIAKEYEIPIEIPCDLENPSKYDNCVTYIEDFSIRFGDITCLDVWVSEPI